MARFMKWLVGPTVMLGALACGATQPAQAQFGISVGVPGAYAYYGAPVYRAPVPAYGYPAGYGYAPGYGYAAGYPAYGGVSVGIGPYFGYRPYGYYGGYYGGYHHHHGRW
jgi:hypothetical protein